MTPITPEDISDLMQTLSSNKSTEPNSIPTSILKEINNSFENGIFPNLLKSAQVIPVFKNGSRLSCNNYRPISLLSNIGKIIEKLIHNRLNHFLEQHKDLPISTWTRDLPISTKVWRNLAKFQPKTEVYISTHPESHCLKFGYEGVCNKRSFKYKETVASTYLS